MPYYNFRLKPDEVLPHDAIEDVHLPDAEAAMKEATRTFGELIRDMEGLPFDSEWRMEVADEEGPIFALSFGAKPMR
ncbi:DUF6894 family protein [Chelativorans sp.]|uniref:DUF6894 family protein n=1 Tax=Chelativorans sp. TaxID=2203393 RepID=UPI0028116B9F|nr:hypothetical protein [Chelativorans sp.]